MITAKEAAEKVKSSQKYEMVIRVKDFDAEHYVVEAIPKANKLPPVGTQTTFGVDKNTGAVTGFSLANNYDRYMSAKNCSFE